VSDARRAETLYSPGGWVALATDRSWLFADVDPTSSAVRAWWEAMHRGASLDDVLGLLVEEGFRAVPSFAVIAVGTGLESGAVALRGSVSVSFTDTHDDLVELSGSDVTTWLRHDFDASIAEIAVAAPVTDDRVRLPLAAGTSMASSLRVRFVTSDRAESAPPITWPSAPAQRAAVKPAEPAPAAPAPAEPAAAEPPTFDHLFGATTRLAPEPEDPPAAAAAPAEVPGVDARTLLPGDTMHGLREADALPPADPEPSTGIISSMPWAVDGADDPLPGPSPSASVLPPPPAAPAPTPVATPPAEGGSTEVTVNRAALLAAANAAAPVAHTGPTVKAIRCAVGHLSPPTATICRLCGAELTQQDAFTAPRPALGSIRLSTGDVIPLDRGIVLGRAPEHDGGNDPDRPNLVKLASPDNDISRTHASVRIDGWHVLVVDHDSTNGTVVTLPGQPPQMLRPNDPLALEPGSIVNLADEVTFVYEIAP